MKITLIEVPESKITYTEKGEEIVVSGVRTNYPKQSQLIIAGSLRELNDVEIEILDMKIKDPAREELYKEYRHGKGKIKCYRKGASFESVKNKIENSDILGLTSNFTKSSEIVIDFMRYAKTINPNIKIITGGSDATARYDFYLKNGADIIILGEGESIGPKVVQALSNNQSLSGITGVAYRFNKGIKLAPRNPIGDKVSMDEIPLPAFDLVVSDLKKYIEAFEGDLPDYVSVPIGIFETSRGCVNNCDFCSTPNLRKNYRFMSTKKIEELLGHYQKYGIRTLLIMEDNILARLDFSGGRKNLIEMFTLMRKKGFAWEFGNGIEFCRLSNNGKIDEELINFLFSYEIKNGRLIGCYRVLIPLETLQDEPELTYPKLKLFDEQIQIIESIAEKNVPRITFGVIIGPKNSSPEHFELIKKRAKKIIKLCEKFGVESYLALYLYTIVPGSWGYSFYKNLVVYDIERYPELYQFNTVPFKTSLHQPHELTLLKIRLEREINGCKINRLLSEGKYDN